MQNISNLDDPKIGNWLRMCKKLGWLQMLLEEGRQEYRNWSQRDCSATILMKGRSDPILLWTIRWMRNLFQKGRHFILPREHSSFTRGELSGNLQSLLRNHEYWRCEKKEVFDDRKMKNQPSLCLSKIRNKTWFGLRTKVNRAWASIIKWGVVSHLIGIGGFEVGGSS